MSPETVTVLFICRKLVVGGGLVVVHAFHWDIECEGRGWNFAKSMPLGRDLNVKESVDLGSERKSEGIEEA